jgi:YidC/Oxa1 family membrane protein insertase
MMPDLALLWGNLILNPMINIMLIMYNFLFHNFGIAIILLTALIRLITMPLTLKQQRSMEKMQELQRSKKWQDIEKKHKGDRQRIQQEQFKLSREVGVSPFGGCLPLLLQFPIIIGLYQSITRALATVPAQLLELSKHIYPTTLIPASLLPLSSHFLAWDLALPEKSTGPTIPGIPIPIPIMTILVVITSYLQTKLTTPPSTDPQSKQMSSMMTLYMPFLLGFFAYSYASGLALYFLTTNLLTIGQYAALGKVNWRSALSLRGSGEPTRPAGR